MQDYTYDVYYIVIDSAGNLIKSPTNLSENGALFEWENYDAVELADGSILAVWQAYSCFPDEWGPRIRYAILDSSFNRVGTPHCLEGGGLTGDLNASVTGDDYGHGILTWQGDEDPHLYYALIDNSGTVLTEPTIFKTGGIPPWSTPYIDTGGDGYGNTSYSLEKIYIPLALK
jgi:hypothetical protein